MSDFEEFSNLLQLYLITLLVDFSCVLEKITRYDFPEARQVILAALRPTLT